MRLLKVWCVDYMHGAEMTIDLDKVESVVKLGDKVVGVAVGIRVHSLSGKYEEFVKLWGENVCEEVKEFKRVE